MISILDAFTEYKKTLFDSKKHCLIFIALILMAFLSMLGLRNIAHPKFELFSLLLVAAIGIFCILYGFRHNDDVELHKTAFVIILCFGLICALMVPICSVSDEKEHLVRAEITSQGVIFPHWNGEDKGLTRLYNLTDGDINKALNEGVGYSTIHSVIVLNNERDLTVFDSKHDTDKINYSPEIFHSAFEQNPFYGYLPQAIGIAIAKLLDLNIIWILWLARIGNVLCYAILVSLAVKKTPCLKVPLLVVALLPISVYQASSVSIDSMVIGLGLLAVSYFIYMYKSGEHALDTRDLAIFTLICILLSLCKLTYLVFIFLLFLVPKENFKGKGNLRISLLLCFILAVGIGLIWSRYASPTLLHSWRSHFQPVNSTMQINYMLSHPDYDFKLLNKFLNDVIFNFHNQFFNFFNSKVVNQSHYSDKYYFINILINVFVAIVLLANPNNVKFDLKTRFACAGIILINYFGTCIVQLLSYTTVGGFNLGLNFRYFIPLLALIPVIFQINYGEAKNIEFDRYALVLSIGFLSAMILAFATKYY